MNNPVLFKIQLQHLVDDIKQDRFPRELDQRRLSRLLACVPDKIHRCPLTLWQRVCQYTRRLLCQS